MKPQSHQPTQAEINELKDYIDEYIDDADAGKNVEDHAENNVHYIFEKAVEIFYGKDIWKKLIYE